MGDYFGHWLEVGDMTDAAKLPRIYAVNWFRKNDDGKFAWPGYGENSRVLKWIVQRLAGEAEAVATPIGHLPAAADLDTDGLALRDGDLDLLLSVDSRDLAEGGRAHPRVLRHLRQPPAGPALGGARVAAGAAEVS